MPVITLFQTKGGTGKTTAAFVLAEILGKGQPTTVIDADQNEPFREWEIDGGKNHGFEIVAFKERDEKGRALEGKGHEVDRTTAVPQAIAEASKRSTFVIVDTEGSANIVSAQAVAMSDLVIITTTGTALDQKAVKKAIKFIRSNAKRTGRAIPYKILFTRQKAIAVARSIKKEIAMLEEAKIPIYEARLLERDAFNAIFGYAATLFNLPKQEVSDPSKAYMNAKNFANETLRTLKEARADTVTAAKTESKELEPA